MIKINFKCSKIGKSTIILGDCLEVIKNCIEENEVDIIISDQPYGTTNCAWDKKIEMNDFIYISDKILNKKEFILKMYKKDISYLEAIKKWEEEHIKGMWSLINICKKNKRVPIILFAQVPFDKELGNSNIKQLKYEWIWEKTQATGHLNSKKMPMKAHENILVFYEKQPYFNPIKTNGHEPMHKYTKTLSTQNKSNLYCTLSKEMSGGGSTSRYPRSVIKGKKDTQSKSFHSTQKPEWIIEYLLRTYAKKDYVCLDYCSGSGTTAVVCNKLGIQSICIEKNEEIYKKSLERIRGSYNERKNM